MKKGIKGRFAILGLALFLSVVTGFPSSSLSAGSFPVNFYYEKYVSKGDLVYMETVSVRELLNHLKSFYLALRGDEGANELMMLGPTLQKEIGINPMDPEALKKIGINIAAPLGMVVKEADLSADPLQPGKKLKKMVKGFIVFLPARNSKTLYDYFRLMLARKDEMNQKAGKAPANFKEIQKNKLFGSETRRVFVARGDKFVVVADNQENALRYTAKSSSPISADPKFVLFKKESRRHYGAMKNISMMFNWNQSEVDLTGLAAKKPTEFVTGMNFNLALAKELAENVTGSGGIGIINADGISYKSLTLYRAGYMTDSSKMYPKIILKEGRPLLADYMRINPVFYLNLKVNFPEFLNMMGMMDPNFKKQMEAMQTETKTKIGMDINEDFFQNIQGSITLLLSEFPPNGKMMNELANWQGSLSVGYKKEKAAVLKQFIEKMFAESEKTDKNMRLKSAKMGSGVLYTIENEKTLPKPPGDQSPPVKKVEYFYLYMGEEEAIMSFNREHIDTVLKAVKGATLMGSLLKISPTDQNRTKVVFYLNVDAVRVFVTRTPLAFMAMPVLPYVQNIDNFHITATEGKDLFLSEMNLRLKKTRVKGK